MDLKRRLSEIGSEAQARETTKAEESKKAEAELQQRSAEERKKQESEFQQRYSELHDELLHKLKAYKEPFNEARLLLSDQSPLNEEERANVESLLSDEESGMQELQSKIVELTREMSDLGIIPEVVQRFENQVAVERQNREKDAERKKQQEAWEESEREKARARQEEVEQAPKEIERIDRELATLTQEYVDLVTSNADLENQTPEFFLAIELNDLQKASEKLELILPLAEAELKTLWFFSPRKRKLTQLIQDIKQRQHQISERLPKVKDANEQYENLVKKIEPKYKTLVRQRERHLYLLDLVKRSNHSISSEFTKEYLPYVGKELRKKYPPSDKRLIPYEEISIRDIEQAYSP